MSCRNIWRSSGARSKCVTLLEDWPTVSVPNKTTPPTSTSGIVHLHSIAHLDAVAAIHNAGKPVGRIVTLRPVGRSSIPTNVHRCNHIPACAKRERGGWWINGGREKGSGEGENRREKANDYSIRTFQKGKRREKKKIGINGLNFAVVLLFRVGFLRSIKLLLLITTQPSSLASLLFSTSIPFFL